MLPPKGRGIAGGPIDEADAWSFAPGTWPDAAEVEIVVEGFFREAGVEYRMGMSRAVAGILLGKLQAALQ
jgi:hypothetical protein